MTYILIIIVSILAVVAIVDLYPQINTWQSRIHIGRWSSREAWMSAVEKLSRAWLISTPVIKLTDNKRLILIDIFKGNYSRKAIQHWQEAGLLLGLTDAYYATGDQSSREAIDRFLGIRFTAEGKWKVKPSEIDGGILAYAVLRLKWIDADFYKPAFDEVYNMILSSVGPDGTVAYRKGLPEYRFVDSVGFISPFLVRYGVTYNVPEAVALGCRQITEFNRFGMLADFFIPCHTYNIDTHLPSGLFGWGRGLGWYAIGLADAWCELPDLHSEKEKLALILNSFAQMALRFQNQHGGWTWNILNEHAVTDSSTTATLAYMLTVAAKLDGLQDTAMTSVRRAENYLMKVTRRDGAVDLSQGDTKDIGIYSHEFNILPFTQGFALRVIHKPSSTYGN